MPVNARLVGLLAACSIATSGCGINPTWQHIAGNAGLATGWIEGAGFRHLVLDNEKPGQKLMIFIEGDGSPWFYGVRVSRDPTPENPVLLKLMVRAGARAVYLGRPCYFGSAGDSACTPDLWTRARYGERVVASLCKAANRLVASSRTDAVELVGYSGGGTLAVLMAGCIDRIAAVTTLAGNLDPESWVDLHGYAPLAQVSIGRMTSAPGSIAESHWQCINDDNVPPDVTLRYFSRRPNAERILIDGCTHATGWGAVIDRRGRPAEHVP